MVLECSCVIFLTFSAMLHDVLGRLFATLLSYGFMLQAVKAAKTAAKSIADMQNVVKEDLESLKEDDMERSAVQGESEDENDKRRKAALDKLEKASEDTILGQACHKYENLNKLYLGFFFSWISEVHNFLIHTLHICLQRSFVL
ncbi:uncharacterized protein LOC114304705 [Camellia sinensis]|uniref:uncharacterized protein LOC114304705 n=1 Tax=Camellia sinensis TaxID=4442 RepID=UPI00103572FF|nr:uncharacterized protein LOC114304705 [Camellia sinensis]